MVTPIDKTAISVIPRGGLGNRMRVMASAYKYCIETQKRARIIWDIDSLLRCDFPHLFTLHTDVIRVESRRIGMLGKYPHRLMDALFYKELGPGEDVPINKDRRLSTCHNFHDAHDYSFLSPSESIEERVHELLTQEDLVGIQIRRTDNANSIKWSPTELFIQKMEEELGRNPGISFYLATDDLSTRAQLVQLFGNKVHYNPASEVRRDTKEGVMNAAVDLYALSLCRKIYGSYYSSFCEVASDIGKNELIVLSKA